MLLESSNFCEFILLGVPYIKSLKYLGTPYFISFINFVKGYSGKKIGKSLLCFLTIQTTLEGKRNGC